MFERKRHNSPPFRKGGAGGDLKGNIGLFVQTPINYSNDRYRQKFNKYRQMVFVCQSCFFSTGLSPPTPLPTMQMYISSRIEICSPSSSPPLSLGPVIIILIQRSVDHRKRSDIRGFESKDQIKKTHDNSVGGPPQHFSFTPGLM